MINIGQEEILKFLKENPDSWFTAKEISKVIKNNYATTTSSFKSLRKFKMVEFAWHPSPKGHFQWYYRCKQ